MSECHMISDDILNTLTTSSNHAIDILHTDGLTRPNPIPIDELPKEIVDFLNANVFLYGCILNLN